MMSQRIAILGSAALLLLVHGCATTKGTRPDDMSADDHRAHAAAEERTAAEHEKKFDPGAQEDMSIVAGPGYWDTVTYNPTAVHRGHADEHKRHAEEHRAAAVELEKFEEAECKSFPPETRKVCPLLGTVEQADDVDGGISVRLSDKLKREAALAHVKCHLAYARKEGRKGMDNCPLYVAGVTARAGDGAQVIELGVEDDANLATLRQRTRDHVRK